MKAKELMIGNLVNIMQGSELKTIALDLETIVQVSQGMVEVEAIPITRELLFKMGFKEDFQISKRYLAGYVFNYKSDEHEDEFPLLEFKYGFFLAYDSGTELAPFSSMPIKYLHELQNLCRILTWGEELVVDEILISD